VEDYCLWDAVPGAQYGGNIFLQNICEFLPTELHYIPVVGNLAAVTSCMIPCFTFTESSRLGYIMLV